MIKQDQFENLAKQSIGLIRINTDKYEYFEGMKKYASNKEYFKKFHCFKGKVLLKSVYDKKKYNTKKGISNMEYFGFSPTFFDAIKNHMKDLRGEVVFLAKLTGNVKDGDFISFKIIKKTDEETKTKIIKYFKMENKAGFDKLSEMLKSDKTFIDDAFKNI